MTGTISLFDKTKNPEPPSKQVFKHFALNALLKIKKKYSNKYGEIILCVDHAPYWRKVVFPHYKGDRDKSDGRVNWPAYFVQFEEFKLDCQKYLPYRYLAVPHCEGDDVVFILAELSRGRQEKSIIISEDKDLLQAQTAKNSYIDQWAPRKRKLIKLTDDDYDLFVHVVKAGDDGIPNILSDADTFMVKEKRQTRMTKKRLQGIIDHKDDLQSYLTEAEYKRYKMNRLLIRADYVPSKIKELILNSYHNYKVKPSRVKTMCIDYSLRNMFDHYQSF